MRHIITVVAGALLIATLPMTAQGATKKHSASKQMEASCNARAAKKYSAVHFLARRDYVKKCMGEKA
jgi:hypothetical protein